MPPSYSLHWGEPQDHRSAPGRGRARQRSTIRLNAYLAPIPEAQLKILLDTNALIAAEPTAASEVESRTGILAELLRLVSLGRHTVFVHPATLDELGNDSAPERRAIRALLVRKYPELTSPPAVTSDLQSLVGSPMPGSHDEVDLTVLASVHRDAVDFLVTSDRGLIRKASTAGLRERVLTPDEAVNALLHLFPIEILPPPAVKKCLAYTLRDTDPIFATLRADYPDFDAWLQKCKRSHREAFVVEDSSGSYDAIAILKPERSAEHGLPGELLKLCTFKVADKAFGRGISELLLKAVLEHAVARELDWVYVECFSRHVGMVAFLEDFGFEVLDGRTTVRRESVLAKPLSPSEEDMHGLEPLRFHIRFGPPAVSTFGCDALCVPIRPEYHEILFPDAQVEPPLFPGTFASGNAIRKAYLCTSRRRSLACGSLLLFYRSRDRKAITSIGVLEKTLFSENADKLVRFVGSRTVFPLETIESMCVKPILALLFRHARTLMPPWELDLLIRARLLNGPPQTITTIRKEGIEWLRANLI